MAGNCSVCGQYLDDIESASVPQDRCWDHKDHPEPVSPNGECNGRYVNTGTEQNGGGD